MDLGGVSLGPRLAKQNDLPLEFNPLASLLVPEVGLNIRVESLKL